MVDNNIDLIVNARIQSVESSNRSIHWTQQCAILNRVNEVALDTKRPREPRKELQLLDLLPDQASLERLKQRCSVGEQDYKQVPHKVPSIQGCSYLSHSTSLLQGNEDKIKL